MKHNFYVVHDFSHIGEEARVTPYYGIDAAMNSFQNFGLGGCAVIIRRADSIYLAQKGDISLLCPMSRVLSYEEKQKGKEMSKSPKVDFDPPVRVRGDETIKAGAPDIDHFRKGHAMRPQAWERKQYEITKEGYILCELGGICNCEICGKNGYAVDLIFSNKPLSDRTHTELMFTHCHACQWTVEMIAVYEGVENV